MTATTYPVHAVNDWDLDVQITTDDGTTGTVSACQTDDGCSQTCASACVSVI